MEMHYNLQIQGNIHAQLHTHYLHQNIGGLKNSNISS